MRSYQPEELFDEAGRLRPELAALAPAGTRRMGANPHANGGLLKRDLELPDIADFAVAVPQPGGVDGEATRVLGRYLRGVIELNAETPQLPHRRPGRDGLEPARRRLRGDRPRLDGADRAL